MGDCRSTPVSLADTFAHAVAEMAERGLTRLSECRASLANVREALEQSQANAAECLLIAAGAGLFPARQPRGSDTAALLDTLGRKSYRIRLAHEGDMPALLALETRCWEPGLRTPEQMLRQRIARYPQGQLVLVLDSAVVGVIYSQRIAREEQLLGAMASSVDALHDASATTVQLLAVNILPDMQQLCLGDELLEFMLIYRSLQASVNKVVAVTLCRNFEPAAAGMSLKDYISHRNERDVLADPILRFHELHGARVEGLVPGYRPADIKNQGCGVLVSYDIRNRRRIDLRVDHAGNGRNRSTSDIQNEVRDAVCACLGQERRAAFAIDRPLMEMGLNSADLLELNERLSRFCGLQLGPAFFFQHNTAEKLVAHLADRLGASAEESSWEPRSQVSRESESKNARPKDVAIVGMACRLPSGIESPDALWRSLRDSISLIGSLPEGRWEWPKEIDPAGRHKGIDRGGFLEDPSLFDAPLFRISPAEAQSTDPQQRILLELCWQAIEHAGYAPSTLAGSKTGVFIGASGSDYARLLDQSGATAEAHYSTGSSMAVLANRISYFYDLIGPSLTLDTACSSSLVAVHEAVRSLAQEEASQALVGGINLILHPANSIAYYKTGMLSKDGLCRTFDKDANGYVRSEGAVVLLLKPLEAALADRDTVYAVIKGTASNHGGRASGLTVPNPEQQSRLLQDASRAAGIDTSSLGYIEAHGTGTPLGDPIEVQGIRLARESSSSGPAAACGLGSIKTNLGHLEAAAGIAGLLKTVVCLQHRELPATLNYRSLNTHIDLEGSGLFVVDHCQPWPAPAKGERRLAGVSSFGSGGTNAHVVLAEYSRPDAGGAAAISEPVLFVLSARTPEQLQVYARHYVEWLRSEEGTAVPLPDLAHLLQTGREAMCARLAMVISERAELIDKLAAFAAKPVDAAFNPATSDTKSNSARVRKLIQRRDLAALAELWRCGVDVDWSLFHGGAKPPQRFAAPTYPFARRSYWLPNSLKGEEPMPAIALSGLAEIREVTATVLAPIWQPVPVVPGGAGTMSPSTDAKILIVGTNAQRQSDLRRHYANAIAIDIDPAATIEELSAKLRALGTIDHVIWCTPDPAAEMSPEEALLQSQQSGLLHAFRLTKAFLSLSYSDKALGWTIVTSRTQAVFANDIPNPAHAAIPGFFGVLAKEHPRWWMRIFDLDGPATSPLEQAMSLSADGTGEVVAYRSGQWFHRVLSPVATSTTTAGVYRQNGVYVVIGGAGGIGEAWTRHVMTQCQAQVIWIGRRPLNADIQRKVQALAALGPHPIYISADAADRRALEAAYEAIRKRCGCIHGVIHAAVGEFDRSVADMDERRFREVLSSKIDASVHVAQAFGREPLDFLLFFSSIVALEKPGGFAGYAAGGTFQDAFGLHLRRQGVCSAKVVNWGHWDVGTGAAISESAKTRLKRNGFAPIQPDEAMAALDVLLSTPIDQIAVVKSARLDEHPLVDMKEHISIETGGMASAIDAVARMVESAEQPIAPVSLFNNAELETALVPLLAATLSSRVLLDCAGASALDNTPAYYRRWLCASLEILRERNIDTASAGNLDGAWRQWEHSKARALGHGDLSAAADLAETCLRALPDILSGRARATDIIFPGSSMRRVEGIYRGNAAADYFNGVLANALVAAIERRLEADPRARLRILEVGAGTGGTTAILLPRLKPYQNIAEYAYTDVSKAFLFYAEEHFVSQYPFVKPKLLDIERPLAGQAVEAGSYDFVVATNVLHATRDIRRTLANCKATMRKGGLLLLNEISNRSLFAHVTFGLLQGWWLTEDQPLRMPNAPGLYPEMWETVLKQQGFPSVVFAAPRAHALGQQIIAAESDGIIRQSTAVAPTASKEATLAIVSATQPRNMTKAESETETEVSDTALKAAANAHLKTLVAKTLRMSSNEIDVREPLEAYGIDSILVVQIVEALRQAFSDVRSTVLFECQTIDALAEHFLLNNRAELIELTGHKAQERAPAPPKPSVATREQAKRQHETRPEQDSIAVIGMSCRFPGADTLEEFWSLLKEGRSAVREVPPDRWPLDGFFHPDPDQAVAQGKSYSKWGAFLDGVTEFDPLFFNISPKDAVAIDPQERLFLQTAWATLEDAGYTPEHLAKRFNRRLGVFVGITRTGFDLFGPELWKQGETINPHTSFSSTANRLSYFLNAQGPSVPVDTMCSSSLTAIHHACQSLRSGESEVALAGGVNIFLHPSSYVGLSAARMLSKDGVCRSFGKGANGFVPGEGVAAVLLKPLSQAIADRDRIYAVIRATHVNHGGKTNGYTVPNPKAQADLVKDAFVKAGIDARSVSYIEAHGTGTELGDPIEVSGLTDAFRQSTQDTGFCALGSAKTNIGHLEAAAGIAGFIKTVLQMRHGQIAPSLYAEEINPKIDLAKTPFVVQQKLGEWKRPKLLTDGEVKEAPRIAGISSFGAGGANAHVVVEEYRETEAAGSSERDHAGPQLIVLSARNEERLKAYTVRLRDFVAKAQAEPSLPSLADVAYTLQVGRAQMDQRLAFVVSSLAELEVKLSAILSGSEDVADVFAGNAKQHKSVISAFADDDSMGQTLIAWFNRGDHARLLALWAAGLDLDWAGLHATAPIAGCAPRRIALPTYPFATTRYWLPAVTKAERETENPVAAPIPAPVVSPVMALQTVEVGVVAGKPSAIKLMDPASVPTTFNAGIFEPRALMPTGVLTEPQSVPEPSSPEAQIALYDRGEGVLSVEIGRTGMAIDQQGAADALVAALEWIKARVHDAARSNATIKAVVISGLGDLFNVADISAPIERVAKALADCPVPVVAVMKGHNAKAAMRLAASADVVICSSEGSYELGGRTLSGPELRACGYLMPVVTTAEIDDHAIKLAHDIARGSYVALTALKKHLATNSAGKTHYPAARKNAGQTRSAAQAVKTGAQRVPLASDIVTLDRYPDGVGVLTLCNRAGKNTFSPEFVSGVITAFEHITGNPDYKAVVLTGYDTYFACGGTREGLLAIQSGKARFTDEQSYVMPLACDVPVIAAMQGHGIGAGWAMGLFCDWAFYSEESTYQSPYMLYGFTPGAGSTLIFPERLGHDLAREVLLSAREFQGRELNERGIAAPVLPRSEVLAHALALADDLAASPREQLVREKNERCATIRDRLQETFAQELAMHDTTFVRNPEVVANIARHFRETAVSEKRKSPAQAAAVASTDQTTSQEVLEALRQSLASELSLRLEDIDDHATFIDVGMDSISAVTWIRKLNERYGLSVGATKIYSHPTLAEFHQYVLRRGREQGLWGAQKQSEIADIAPPELSSVEAEQETSALNEPILLRSFPISTLVKPPAPGSTSSVCVEAETRSPPQPEPRAASNPQTSMPAIAIIGMSGQFPKARDLAEFWRNIAEGRDCISEVPPSRWSIEDYYDPDKQAPGKTVCRHLGVLEDIDVFDPLFFNISPSEAEYMDPQQRLFLENSWRCIEDAGYDPTSLSETACGVFVGCQANDYSKRAAGRRATAHGLIGESVAMLPARIAYFLNLRGPCLAIDTACSASLVALANACDSLALGRCTTALAGGVNISDGPDIHVKMSSAGMLSPDGRCFTFDQRANGFVLGEGVGVLLLKRLEDAERDGDAIHAVIRGWSVNQDGKTNGITAPNQQSQTALEAGLYRKFGIDPADIQLVETHGTGTKLGDPIEIEALCGAFREFTRDKHFCALGSVKSNIGHLATAAGVTGVIKATLALKHAQLPPTINFTKLNEDIALGDSPFYVNTELKPWPKKATRRLAAVSSFGFSGTNAHVVLEAYEQRVANTRAVTNPSGAVVLPLSAKSREQLAQYARELSDHLDSGLDAQLADIAFTYQIGRTAMEHRLAVIASSVEELKERLRAFASSGTTSDRCVYGEVTKRSSGTAREANEGPASVEHLAAVAKCWMQGGPVDWMSVQGGRAAQRLQGLPTYPFARERYWLSDEEPPVEVTPEAAAPAPLQASTIDISLWQSSSLAETIDWRSRLEDWLNKQTLVVYADEAEREAFARLLAQLTQATEIQTSGTVRYCRVEALERALAASAANCVLVLSSASSGLLKNLQLARSAKCLAADIRELALAEEIGEKLAANTELQNRVLLVSQSHPEDYAAGIQTLLREWLAFGLSDEGELSEIHYAGAERLQRQPRAIQRPSNPICFVQKTWAQAAPIAAENPHRRGTLLIIVNAESAAMGRELFASAEFASIVLAGGPNVEGATPIDLTSAEAGMSSAKAVLARHKKITHIVDISDLYSAPQSAAAEASGKVALYQALVGALDDLSILYVTKGLQAFQSPTMSLAGAKFAGLVRMLSAEYRHVDARLADIDQPAYDAPRNLGELLLKEFDSELQQTEVCYRNGERFIPRLALDKARYGASAQCEIAKDAVYVVSGGTNGVGLELAKHLVAKGCRKLVLMGKTQLPPKDQWSRFVARKELSSYLRDKLQNLVDLDAAVDHLEVYGGALTDQSALRRSFMKVRATLGPIRGVIHAAGTYSDATTPGFADKSFESMRRVWEPKVSGLENLHAVFEADPLDFFVSLSSMTGLIPNLARGAADYAMANAFVEFYTAYHNHQQGRFPLTSVVWSDWNETGGITRISQDRAVAIDKTFADIGLRSFSNAEGFRLFDAAMSSKAGSRVIIGYVDRGRFEEAAPGLLLARRDGQAAALAPEVAPSNSILAHLEAWETETRQGAKVPVERITDVISLDEIRALDPPLISRIHAILVGGGTSTAQLAMPPDYRQAITTTVMGVLKLKSVNLEQPLQNYGLDSISATVLATRLEKMLNVEIRPQWLIEFPTIEALARHLTAQADKSRQT